jgi:hypothetical protein
MDKMELAVTLLTIAYVLLLGAFVMTLPLMREGYDHRVVKAYENDQRDGIIDAALKQAGAE